MDIEPIIGIELLLTLSVTHYYVIEYLNIRKISLWILKLWRQNYRNDFHIKIHYYTNMYLEKRDMTLCRIFLFGKRSHFFGQKKIRATEIIIIKL